MAQYDCRLKNNHSFISKTGRPSYAEIERILVRNYRTNPVYVVLNKIRLLKSNTQIYFNN